MEDSKAFTESRKRPLELNIQDSPYYKMRALLKDLRPHIIEVLKTPDFRNCKAADDIREGMKVLMELYKEMTEATRLEKCNNNIPGYSYTDNHEQDMNPAESSLQDVVFAHCAQGTYIVGGSAFGWNFITFHGTNAVYYGRTKEAFRASNPKSS
ncbi:hypothetical protein ACJIZ3_018455 [Penstemon smallii]|uniref:Uncharacterized protein n=1 Tax=Penstemon smallii TaxID=265156 RepID=A0ABD3SZR8_9LAMI